MVETKKKWEKKYDELKWKPDDNSDFVVSECDIEEIVEVAQEESELVKAEAQLLGFTHNRDGYNLQSLISSMALSLKEWNQLQEEYGLDYLTEEDKKIIQEEVEK